ncbi:MAG: RelA/SpoT family protein [Bacteroidia bacterium]|nr:RelA/SpoT family protein [Bacteroidia bacterium]
MINIKQENQKNYDQEIIRGYRSIIRAMRNTSRTEKATIRRAFEYARDAHEGVRRKSGEPYILHPLAVAKIVVVEMGLEDTTAVVCALLHDVVEDTEIELEDIRREFGNKAMEIINGLTKMSGSVFIDEMNSTQAETFRKVLLTISDDIRVILIKLADRLHNMRTMGSMRQESMLKITSETLYIYAPVAHRLGLYETKTELEDLSFKHSNPTTYQEIEKKLIASKEEAQAYIDRFIKRVKQALKHSGLNFKVKSRFKSIYSIYVKMLRKNLPFEEVYDKYAIRIILESRENREREDCWYVYSTLSGIFRPNPKRLRDWITVPKDNSYESLHTTLLGPEGQWVEVQIRTQRMDDIAEKGIAAHWKYKEDGELYDDFLTEWIGQIREILENPSLNALEAVREFKENLQPNDVFVFTPKGKMMRLPPNSTILDFAYKIHSQLGNQAIGAKVNNRVVTLEYTLKPGDTIEVLTSKKQKPKEEWLRLAKTVRAREHIKTALKKERKEFSEQGRLMFIWKARQYDVDENHPFFKELLAYFMVPSAEEFFYQIGAHKIDTRKIPEFIHLKKEGKQIENLPESVPATLSEQLEEFGVKPDMLVLGKEQNFENYVLSKCCNPLPGDDILGFDEGKRIVIHRTSCEEAISLMSSFGSKIIRARWAEGRSDVSFLTAIKVVGLDKQGMLNDLIRIISLRMKLNIRKVTIESRNQMFEGLFTVYVHNIEELSQLMSRMEALTHVYTVSRVDHNYQPFQ